MFSTRPLTWLFVLAIIAGDVAFMSTTKGAMQESLFSFACLIGQVTTLAIWAIRGNVHRLLRISCLSVGLLICLLLTGDSGAYTFLYVHVAVVTCFTFLVEWARFLQATSSSESTEKWQIPLIEFFGWMIVVALISLSMRSLEFDQVFRDNIEAWWQLLAILAVPIFWVMFIRSDLRDLKALKALMIVAVGTTAEWYLGFFVVTTVVAHLVAWQLVVTLDNIRAETNQIESKLHPEELAVEPPKIYKPHPLD